MSGRTMGPTTPKWPLLLIRKSTKWLINSAWASRRKSKRWTACREKLQFKSNSNVLVSWLTSNLIFKTLTLVVSRTTWGRVQAPKTYLRWGASPCSSICLCAISRSKSWKWRTSKIWSLKWTLTTKNSWMSLTTTSQKCLRSWTQTAKTSVKICKILSPWSWQASL